MDCARVVINNKKMRKIFEVDVAISELERKNKKVQKIDSVDKFLLSLK